MRFLGLRMQYILVYIFKYQISDLVGTITTFIWNLFLMYLGFYFEWKWACSICLPNINYAIL